MITVKKQAIAPFHPVASCNLVEANNISVFLACVQFVFTSCRCVVLKCKWFSLLVFLAVCSRLLRVRMVSPGDPIVRRAHIPSKEVPHVFQVQTVRCSQEILSQLLGFISFFCGKPRQGSGGRKAGLK